MSQSCVLPQSAGEMPSLKQLQSVSTPSDDNTKNNSNKNNFGWSVSTARLAPEAKFRGTLIKFARRSELQAYVPSRLP